MVCIRWNLIHVYIRVLRVWTLTRLVVFISLNLCNKKMGIFLTRWSMITQCFVLGTFTHIRHWFIALSVSRIIRNTSCDLKIYCPEPRSKGYVHLVSFSLTFYHEISCWPRFYFEISTTTCLEVGCYCSTFVIKISCFVFRVKCH